MQKLGIYSTHLHADTNPGAPGKFSGPRWASTVFDLLLLPNGRKIGDVPNEDLRHEFARLGIEDAHTLGREALCQRYSDTLRKIGDAAASKAIAEFLQSKKV